MSKIGKIISCGRAIFIFDLCMANSRNDAESMVRISEPKVGHGERWKGKSSDKTKLITARSVKNAFIKLSNGNFINYTLWRLIDLRLGN